MATGYSMSALVDKVEAIESLPEPDFHLPLKDNLLIKTGKGSPVMVDVSQAQDGSVMAPVPGLFQADFTRASKKTCIQNGQLVEVGINEPAFEDEGILIEGASTNILPNSEGFTSDFYQSNQSSGATTVTIKKEGIFSYANIVKNQPGWCLIGYNKPLEVGKTYTGSVYLRHISGANAFRVCLQGSASNGQPYQVGTSVTLSSGVWTKVSTTWTVEAGKDNAGIQVRLGVDGTTAEYEMDFMAFQIEELPFASSYIPTEGTAVTRAQDEITISGISIESSATIIMELGAKAIDPWSRFFSVANRDAVKSITLFSNAAINYRNIRGKWNDSPETGFYEGADSLRDNNKRLFAFVTNGESFSVFINSLLVSMTPYQTTPITDAILSPGWSYGDSGGHRGIYGYIKDFRIWNRALTANQIAAIGAKK